MLYRERLLHIVENALVESDKMPPCQPLNFTLPTVGIDAGLGVSLGPALLEIRQTINSLEGIKKPQAKVSMGGLSRPRVRTAPRRGRGRRNMQAII